MPSPPSAHHFSSRTPSLQAADLPSKQQCGAALAADPAHVSSRSQLPWSSQTAEGLPPATSACLRVLDEILSSASPAAVAADIATNQNGAHSSTQPAGRGDKTCCGGESIKAGLHAQNAAEVVVESEREQPKRSRHERTMEVECRSVATHDDVTRSERRESDADTTEDTRKGSEVQRLRIVKSFVSIFKVLHSAGVLDTLPKCFHMLHAICILADQQRQSFPSTGTSTTVSPSGVLSSSSKKRKIVTEGCTATKSLANTAQPVACDDRCTRRCSPNTNSVGSQDQGKTNHSVNEHGGSTAESVLNTDAGSTLSLQADAGMLTTDCERLAAVCYCERAQTHHFPGDRQGYIASPLYRQERIAQVAGLLLGYIEALEAPPPLSDPRFHQKVLHVVCRVLYSRHPVEEEHITASGASTTLPPAVNVIVGNSYAAIDDSGVNSRKTASGTDGTTSESLDAYSAREHWCWTGSNVGVAVTSSGPSPQEWRQQIIVRFDIVERLLLCSVPALFLSDAPSANAEETSGEEGDADKKSLRAGSMNLTADSAADKAAGKSGVAARERESNRSDVDNKQGGLARPAASQTTASTAALIQGRERCRRALRMVRRWVAFLLELEHERQTLVERVLQASEEVQGLPHMLLQGRRQQEQAQQLSPSYGENTCASVSTSKRKSLLSLGMPTEEGAVPNHQKYGIAKEAAGDVGGGAEETLEELEIRIRATQQVLLLPSIPPFTRVELETVRTARTRFERCLLRWREAKERRRQEEEEAKRKSAAAAAAVLYVTERIHEQQQAQAVVYSTPPGTAAAATALLRLRSVSHAFYLLGLNPQTATFQMVEQVRKKWRVLLHPDKFVSTHSHLLQQATEAFKAFHVAVTEANRLLMQRRVEPSWSPPPPPPDITTGTYSPAAVAATSDTGATTVRQHANSESRQTPGKNNFATAAAASTATAANPSFCGGENPETNAPCCPTPTHQFSPDVTVQVSRNKKKACVGGLTIQVHGSPSREKCEWPFATIKEIRIFVLRPTLSDGPSSWKLVPSSADVFLLITKTVTLTCTCPAATRENSASSTTPDVSSVCPGIQVEIDALQPFELGVEKMYWVGIQVEGLHKSQSLVNWKPVAVCLTLPEDAENSTPSRVTDSRTHSTTIDDGASGSDANVSCTDNMPATHRALLAFLQTFTVAPFVKKDCSFNGRLQDAISSLKRVLRHRKKSNKRSQQSRECGQDAEEYKWVRDEAKHVLRECMERGRKWGSEADRETVPSDS